MDRQVSPVLEKDRIISLDIMRGFAILGIFLVNMLSFHSPYLTLILLNGGIVRQIKGLIFLSISLCRQAFTRYFQCCSVMG